MIKLNKNVEEIFLSFQSKTGKKIPVLMNVCAEEKDDSLEMHCAGMQITGRSKLEKDILAAKESAENAVSENKELLDLKARLQENERNLEKKLQRITQVNAEHNQINAILSHDLQEPLRKLSMFSNLLNTAVYDKSQEKNYLNKINELTSRVRNLVQGMQRFHAIDEESMIFREFDIIIAVQRAIESLNFERRQFLDGNVKIESSTLVEGDLKMMITVLAQLLDNSVKFQKNDVPLLISLDVSEVHQNVFQQTESKYSYEPFTRIIYLDNGIGFDGASTNRVFDLFRKGHHNEEGFGIGLAYCRKIIELQRGWISAASSPGNGVEITIFLPKRVI